VNNIHIALESTNESWWLVRVKRHFQHLSRNEAGCMRVSEVRLP